MKRIKKVSVSDLPENEGKIIDSFNTSDDKHTNAPSLNAVMNYIYPVGSIYMSVNSTSPAILFGGTWEKLKDRFLLGAGDTYSNGATGGEATHHHTLNDDGYAKIILKASGSVRYREKRVSDWISNYSVNGGSAADDTEIQTYGAVLGGQTANTNNMPPYLVVNMWKRTA